MRTWNIELIWWCCSPAQTFQWLPISNRLESRIFPLVCKIFGNLVPCCYSNLISQFSPTHSVSPTYQACSGLRTLHFFFPQPNIFFLHIYAWQKYHPFQQHLLWHPYLNCSLADHFLSLFPDFLFSVVLFIISPSTYSLCLVLLICEKYLQYFFPPPYNQT